MGPCPCSSHWRPLAMSLVTLLSHSGEHILTLTGTALPQAAAFFPAGKYRLLVCLCYVMCLKLSFPLFPAPAPAFCRVSLLSGDRALYHVTLSPPPSLSQGLSSRGPATQPARSHLAENTWESPSDYSLGQARLRFFSSALQIQ